MRLTVVIVEHSNDVSLKVSVIQVQHLELELKLSENSTGRGFKLFCLVMLLNQLSVCCWILSFEVGLIYLYFVLSGFHNIGLLMGNEPTHMALEIIRTGQFAEVLSYPLFKFLSLIMNQQSSFNLCFIS